MFDMWDYDDFSEFEDEDDESFDGDELCAVCGEPGVDACDCCGGTLCEFHAEVGAMFCDDCPTEEWIAERRYADRVEESNYEHDLSRDDSNIPF